MDINTKYFKSISYKAKSEYETEWTKYYMLILGNINWKYRFSFCINKNTKSFNIRFKRAW